MAAIVDSFTCDLYPISNYDITEKAEQLLKDDSPQARLQRMKKEFEYRGMKHCIYGVFLVHHRKHPHVLLFETEDGSFRLYALFFSLYILAQKFLILIRNIVQ